MNRYKEIVMDYCNKLAVYTCFSFLAFILITGGHAAASENKKVDITCPSMNFHQFIKAFSDDESIQRKFTKLPLKNIKFNFQNRSNIKKVTLLSKENDIPFPIIPLKMERKKKGLQIETFSTDTSSVNDGLLLYLPQPDYDANHQEMVAIKSDKWQIFYNFEKTETCWYLVSIDDKTLISKDGDIVPNWLDWIFFQRPSSCLPLTFYYNKDDKRSNIAILEKLGYTPYKIERDYLYYAINEKFYGLNATEIIIPQHGDTYNVTVSVDAQTLSDAIFGKIGKRLQIYTKGSQMREGVAYIFPKDKSNSFFICPFDH